MDQATQALTLEVSRPPAFRHSAPSQYPLQFKRVFESLGSPTGAAVDIPAAKLKAMRRTFAPRLPREERSRSRPHRRSRKSSKAIQNWLLGRRRGPRQRFLA